MENLSRKLIQNETMDNIWKIKDEIYGDEEREQLLSHMLCTWPQWVRPFAVLRVPSYHWERSLCIGPKVVVWA